MLKKAGKPPITLGVQPSLLAPVEFYVTYGTGGVKSPVSLQVLSLTKFYSLLCTVHQAQTVVLNERWHPFTSTTKLTRLRQYELIENTFPFLVAGATFDEAAAAADDEDDWAGWQTPSGLVVLTFKYSAAKGNEVVTLWRRQLLQEQLLGIPLLGPSIRLIFKEPGECLLHVLVAAGPVKEYGARVNTMMRYLDVVRPKLDGTLWGGDIMPTIRHSVGYDPLAYLRPATEGYIPFPVQEALAAIKKGRSIRR